MHRVPLGSLKKHADLGAIRDPVIRNRLMEITEGLDGREFKEAVILAGEQMNPPVRRVRICETLSVIPIQDKRTGRPYKAYKGDNNYCYEVFKKSNGKWTGRVISRFEANQKTYDPNSNVALTGEPLIMRLRQDDLLAVEDGSPNNILRVVKFSSGSIVMAPHFEGGSLKKRDADADGRVQILDELTKPLATETC